MNLKNFIVGLSITAVCTLSATFAVKSHQYQSQNQMTDLEKANLEALSDGENNPGPYYEGYYNDTIEIYDYQAYVSFAAKLPIGINIEGGMIGIYTYCKSSFWPKKKCYLDLNKFVPINN